MKHRLQGSHRGPATEPLAIPGSRFPVPGSPFERAMYADAVGEMWAAGGNLLATRLR